MEAGEVSERPWNSKGARRSDQSGPYSRGVSPPTVRSVVPLLVVSGASALIFEVVWVRALTLWFGRTLPAVTTVLAAFMGGLALGGILFGRLADRSRRPLAFYGALEVGVGVLGLAVSVLVIDGTLLVPVARSIATTGALEPTIRFLAFFAVLIVPAALMGGTVPVVGRAFARGDAAGRGLGIVYAANTTGAVLGALAPDLVAIPRIGMAATASCAALADLGVGLWVLTRWGRTESDPPAPLRDPRNPRVAYALFAVSGFAAMGYELVWARMLEHVTGVAASFSVLLACYLLALAAGTWIATPLADRAGRPLRWAALTFTLSGVLALLPFVFLQPGLAQIVAWVPDDPALARQPLHNALARALGVSLLLALGPCLAMGATFPFLGAFAMRSRGPGAAAGHLLAVNTFAGVAGTLVTGFVLLPSLGTQGTVFLLAIVALAAAALVLGWTRDRAAVVAFATLLVALAVVRTVPAHRTVNLLFDDPGETLDVVVEGAVTSVAVASHGEFGGFLFKELLTPGVSMSNTGFGARRYMGMMGHVPLLLSRERKDALLVCFGVGNTARSLLAHPELERLHIVDLAPEVLALSPHFAEATGSDPLTDPRVTIAIDDGRHHVLTTSQRYDVVTAEPPPPTNAGVVNLYSHEYYEGVKRVLKPGGIVAQWLPVVALSEREDRAIIAAFVSALPYTALFYGYKHQWFLVGSETPLEIDPDAWEAAIAAPSTRADLASLGVGGVGDLLGAFLADDATLRAVAGAEILTDDRPSLQYPIDVVKRPPPVPPGLVGSPFAVRSLLRSSVGLEPYERALRASEALYAQLPWVQHPILEVRHLLLGTTLWPWLDGDDPGRQARLESLEVGDARLALARRRLASEPTHPGANFVVGARAYYDRDFSLAASTLGSIDGDADLMPSVWLLRAGAARMLGEIDTAREDLGRAADATRTPAFRESVRMLIEHVEDPPGARGPLGPPG